MAQSAVTATRTQVPATIGQQGLFRQEVLEERQTPLLGKVLLEPRASQTLLVGASVALGLAVLAFLVFGSYARKARLNGVLVPTQGIARIVAPQTGVVTEIFVSEGANVKRGAPLIALSSEMQSEALTSTREEIVRRITNRRDSTAANQHVQEALFDQQTADLRKQLDALDDRTAASWTGNRTATFPRSNRRRRSRARACNAHAGSHTVAATSARRTGKHR